MKLLKKITILLLLSSNYAYAYHLPDDDPVDTIRLKEVEVTANRLINFTIGAKIHKVNSSEIASYNSVSLSELFTEISTISIKSYGKTGLSNVSIRGMGSKHTAVLWNGFNLQSSMNGGSDMNTLPAFLIDEISIQYGGASALFGSGAIGGVIHLGNSLKFDNNFGVSYNQNLGSFNNYFEGLKINYSSDKFASSTRVYYDYGKNDFEFRNTQMFGSPIVKQKNSETKKYGLLQSNKFKINNKQSVSTNIWVQDYYREIPAMITSSSSVENENSELMRISSAWNRSGEISSWYARAYYNYENLVYTDTSKSLVSVLNNDSWIGEIENKTSLNSNLLMNIGFNNTYEKVKTNNYNSVQTRNRAAFYSSLKYFNNNKTFAAVISLREELIDYDLTPLTLSLSSRYHFYKNLNINVNVSKNYNLPTFNDLYWMPGGNPDLKAENGWSEDLGVNYNQIFGSHFLNIEATAFNINLKNHVIWLPTTSTYWSAANVEKLWSRGIESSLKYSYNNSNFKIATKLLYTYTKSTYEKSDSTEESSIGKQLMYIPVHKGSFNIKLIYKKNSLSYNHNYVGKRYTTKDNSGYVEPYHVTNLALGRVLTLKTSSINLNFKINNIWNTKYEVMAFRAMPLRHYSISITYNFNKQLN